MKYLIIIKWSGVVVAGVQIAASLRDQSITVRHGSFGSVEYMIPQTENESIKNQIAVTAFYHVSLLCRHQYCIS